MQTAEKQNLVNGGEFLLRTFHADEVFIPEDYNEEQRAMSQMAYEFVEQVIEPEVANLDAMKDPTLMPSLLTKAGEQGLLGMNVPESYGGIGVDTNTAMLVTEQIGRGYSFSVALLAHSGIGTLPLLYFGNDEQKDRYLAKLATGEWKAAYCLTEPGSGSDALGAKTKAVLSADGSHYVLTGQKMWITNGGFADLFTVFAKVDGEKFTAFLVERSYDGISMNEEEKKMGIKGSSTRQIFFNDVKVPVGNVLGEIGKGHRVAFNILNIGRLKLSAATLGGAKAALNHAIKYANERVQFGQTIGSFGAIQHKLAEMAIRIYANESATYRSTNDVDAFEKHLHNTGASFETALLNAAQEFASECAMMKVHGSETLDYVVDEGVQVFGGYGFSAEYPMDRAYRDSRINRIYEGTNEINRILSVSYIMNKALKGELDLMTPAMAIQQELMSGNEPAPKVTEGPLAAEHSVVENLKKAILLVAGAAAQKYMQELQKEQEVVMHISDMLIETYAVESTLLRVQKLAAQGKATPLHEDIVRTLLTDAAERVYDHGKNAVLHIAEGGLAKGMLKGLRTYTRTELYDTVAGRRRIAQQLLTDGHFKFSID